MANALVEAEIGHFFEIPIYLSAEPILLEMLSSPAGGDNRTAGDSESLSPAARIDFISLTSAKVAPAC